MKLISTKRYPKSVLINGDTYQVKFRKMVLKDPDCLGACDPEQLVIYIKKGQHPVETLKTFIHEVLHALSFSEDFKLKHKTVYALEEAIYKFIRDNFN